MIADSRLRALAGVMLRDSARRLSNESCNDFDLSLHLNADEITEFVRAYHEWNGDPEEFTPGVDHRHDLSDFAVAEFLAHMLGDTP